MRVALGYSRSVTSASARPSARAACLGRCLLIRLRRPRWKAASGGRCARATAEHRLDRLLSPTPEEEAALEGKLGVDIPTREEMEEIEVSSRLYQEDGAAFMTATLPARTDTDDLLMGAVTFALVHDKLVTVRYHEPRAFKTFPQRAEKLSIGCTDGETVLIALLEAIVDRLADILERAQRDVDAVSRDIFGSDAAQSWRAGLEQRLAHDRP